MNDSWGLSPLTERIYLLGRHIKWDPTSPKLKPPA